MKKTFLLALMSFIFAGCSAGSVQVTDLKGNKYTFKPGFVTCRTETWGAIGCQGQAIKKNMAGRRYVVQLRRRVCDDTSGDTNYLLMDHDAVVCEGARRLGIYQSKR